MMNNNNNYYYIILLFVISMIQIKTGNFNPKIKNIVQSTMVKIMLQHNTESKK